MDQIQQKIFLQAKVTALAGRSTYCQCPQRQPQITCISGSRDQNISSSVSSSRAGIYSIFIPGGMDVSCLKQLKKPWKTRHESQYISINCKFTNQKFNSMLNIGIDSRILSLSKHHSTTLQWGCSNWCKGIISIVGLKGHYPSCQLAPLGMWFYVSIGYIMIHPHA